MIYKASPQDDKVLTLISKLLLCSSNALPSIATHDALIGIQKRWHHQLTETALPQPAPIL